MPDSLFTRWEAKRLDGSAVFHETLKDTAHTFVNVTDVGRAFVGASRLTRDVGKAVRKFYPSQFHSPVSVSLGRKALRVV